LILEPTTDQALIKEVISDPGIWDRMAEDGVDKEGFWPSVDDNTSWLLCIDDGDICGIILAHIETGCSISIHPYLKREHRRKGRDMMTALFKRFIEHTPAVFVKLNAVVPDCYKSTQNFAKRVGFKEEGISRCSYRKDGEVFDRRFYGITRKEIEARL